MIVVTSDAAFLLEDFLEFVCDGLHQPEPHHARPVRSSRGSIDGIIERLQADPGHDLPLTFPIVEGKHKDRFLWARLNLAKSNAVAVQFAKAELSVT